MPRRTRSAYLVPAALIAIVAMMVIPLPAPLLDALLVVSLGTAAVILLSALTATKPLELSSFPSVLLVATLFRLALNVSSSRLILLHGDAGAVIEAFGKTVIGGSLAVGLVVFFILVVIQFVVITQGSTRVAEVGARFTLDALPGKQLAIDADLNAGIINEVQAKQRREEIATEAEFYGAMDGASKFVKGDAIAGMVIVVTNLLGGFAVGILQHGMSFGEAVETFSLLTVGDGLVSQIPALLISVAAGVMVTRTGTSETGSGVGADMLAQFGGQQVALRVAAAAMVVFALVPGLPRVPFLLVAGILAWTSRKPPAPSLAEREAAAAAKAAEPEPVDPDSPEALYASIKVEPMQVELAGDLLELANPNGGGDLLARIKGLRRKFAGDMGFVLGPIRIRDSVELTSRTYRVRLHGVQVAAGTLPEGAVLVIGDNLDSLDGTATTDPVFNLPAKWAPEAQRPRAETLGTVVDHSAVIVTHLTEVLRANAGDLLGRQDVKTMVGAVTDEHPAIGEDLQSANVTIGEIHACLTGLLEEGIPVRDLTRILEAVADAARTTRDPGAWVEAARSKLGAAVGDSFAIDGRLAALTLSPEVEAALASALTHPGGVGLGAGDADALLTAIAGDVNTAELNGERPALVVPSTLRPHLRNLVAGVLPRLPVISYNELGPSLQIDVIGAIRIEHRTV